MDNAGYATRANRTHPYLDELSRHEDSVTLRGTTRGIGRACLCRLHDGQSAGLLEGGPVDVGGNGGENTRLEAVAHVVEGARHRGLQELEGHDDQDGNEGQD